MSGHLKVMKPDPAIYRIVEADCGIAPGALLFADDRRQRGSGGCARVAGASVRGGRMAWAGGWWPRVC
jgi:2-haloacid dehalogenase